MSVESPVVEPRILGRPGDRYPPGPSLLWHLATAKPMWQNPIETLTQNARRYGDLVHFRALDGHVFQFNHPALIQEFLTENEKRNRRVKVMQRARSFLGDGLLTSEEPLHMRQRRMAAPAFHRQRITAYADVIAQFAAEVCGRWQPGVRDLHPEMLHIALRIVGKTLFDIDDEAEALEITRAFDTFRGAPPPPSWVPERWLLALQNLPIGPMTRIREGMQKIDSIIYGMIAERRRAPGDRGDLLSMLLDATDPEEGSGCGARMSDKLVRDECLTIILAGHETTANVLSFAMWLLAKYPEVGDALHEEAVRVLGARRPTAADYPELKYSYMVFAEVMRLYPTVWVIGRSAGPEAYSFRGFTIPPGAALLAPQIVVHRDPRFWEEPERFNPRRFAAEEGKSARPRYAYFPFGGGARQCIGEALAWMEGVFTLSTVARDWRLQPKPGEPAELPLQASINLRPKRGVPLVLERR